MRGSRRSRIRAAALVVASALALAACDALGISVPVAGSAECQTVYPADRCERLAFAAVDQTGIDPADIVAIRILPPPTPQVLADGTVVLQTLGGARPIELQVEARDGTIAGARLCGGLPSAIECTDTPILRVESVTSAGYRNVPCTDPEAGVCATPLPAVDREAEADAEPLRLDRLDIPIDRTGRIEVSLGTGSLPNGILTEASFRFLDDWPEDLLIAEGSVQLEVRSLAPDGKPFDNHYLHGWREGVEPFEAVLVFAVDRFDPGATLSIADVIVR